MDEDIEVKIKEIIEPPMCTICLEFIFYSDKSQIKLTNCNHIFHSECLSNVASEQIDEEEMTALCPNCRTEIAGQNCILAFATHMNKYTDEIFYFKSYLERYKIENEKLIRKCFKNFLHYEDFDKLNPQKYLYEKARTQNKIKQNLNDYINYNKDLSNPLSPEMYE